MARLTLDNFIEAFAARLVTRGQNMVRLNDPSVRDALYRVFRFLDERAKENEHDADKEWRRSLVAIRNVFRPSAIGSFDRFEALLRAKQVYLTDHPNPFYQDIVIELPNTTAEQIVDRLDVVTSDLVKKSVERYLSTS